MKLIAVTDYKERFKEKFPQGGASDSEGNGFVQAYTKDILAFIDLEMNLVSQRDFKDGWEQGAAEERSLITSLIEGMRRTDDTQMSHDHAYDEALDDLLSKIRGEEKPEDRFVQIKVETKPIQEETLGTAWELDVDESSGVAFLKETACCEKCAVWDGLSAERKTICSWPNCPFCHKPRTEETEKKMLVGIGGVLYPDPAFEETEKEGASFSGRVDPCPNSTGGCSYQVRFNSSVLHCVHCGNPRPKETPTPQSREQGGEWCDNAQNCPRRHPKSEPCKETNHQ